MSKWINMNKQRLDYVIGELRKLYYMNIDTGDLNLNNVIVLINGMSNELVKVERERDEKIRENENLKLENVKLREENERIKNVNSST